MNQLRERIVGVLEQFLSEIMSRSIVNLSLKMAKVDIDNMGPGDERRLYKEIEKGVRIYIPNPMTKQHCTDLLQKVLGNGDRTSFSGPTPQ